MVDAVQAAPAVQPGAVTHLLIVCNEAVGTSMAGPAIRCWELARELSRHTAVTLAVPGPTDTAPVGFELAVYSRGDPSSLVALAGEADVVFLWGDTLQRAPQLASLGCRIIADLYDPYPIENLELHQHEPLARRLAVQENDYAVLEGLARSADFFVCGSERQRDFWLGILAAHGRLNPLTHDADPTFRALIDIVPFGLPEAPPVAGQPVKGVEPGIDVDDQLVVWPGGVWDWLDPLTAVEAIGILRDEGAGEPPIKLLFLGLRHPHPEIVGPMANPRAVIGRAEQLGLLGSRVFYHDWTPYAERERFLLGADAMISLHHDHLETRFALRTRLLDCIWAGRPVVATAGDVLAEEMAERRLALLVPPRDARAVAEAIRVTLAAGESPARQARFAELATTLRWSVVARPLVRYLADARPAPDLRPVLAHQAEALDIRAIGEPTDDALVAAASQRVDEPSGYVVATAAEAMRLRQILAEREAELADARDLLERIARGRVMRLLNCANRLFGRSPRQ